MKIKKNISGLLLSAFVLSMLNFASCKKCGHCEYSYYGYTDTDATYCSGPTTRKQYKDLKSTCQLGGGTWVEE